MCANQKKDIERVTITESGNKPEAGSWSFNTPLVTQRLEKGESLNSDSHIKYIELKSRSLSLSIIESKADFNNNFFLGIFTCFVAKRKGTSLPLIKLQLTEKKKLINDQPRYLDSGNSSRLRNSDKGSLVYFSKRRKYLLFQNLDLVNHLLSKVSISEST
ncbi:hypothetical protein PHYBLDRAFT_165729 [Phycomyces blakesleeanus NRRL 1555(-)]|uniref:Uncharacterized protein n=1 Tax=Phycomyces blakesleeanus (strain ATCC 8743b / DSM 1359 / FGSC 10004 / NBRC 33097 / NRRL 1555) TaxID=763407 RepID=A0A167P4Q6_PHYB8|nr:hypothetical protein PHYBLDRAFT_165729 [Phycomyces blakesleeanus NRRL 1555(-)]OAD77241.1 hypothetical protein PHYBLDRAFT_165729 [Phycomyces blakesleeanus NRRL 1555(-)]|eukprot:XP_018295281.1 hypothetical protein PHYBLDRAFT_165729 [Phycomyces blakesleeanus NRRL 1555(-)]